MSAGLFVSVEISRNVTFMVTVCIHEMYPAATRRGVQVQGSIFCYSTRPYVISKNHDPAQSTGRPDPWAAQAIRVHASTGQRKYAVRTFTVSNSVPSALHNNSLPTSTFKTKLKTHIRRRCDVKL